MALVAGWVFFGAMLFGMSLLGPMMMFALIIPVSFALGVLPALHGRAAASPTCRTCGRIVEPGPEPQGLTLVPLAEEAPARSSLMPPMVASALAGALVVGSSAAALVHLAVAPLSGHGFSTVETLFVGLIGAMFGVIAGGVAGASAEDEPSEPSPEVAEATMTLRRSA